TVDKPTAPLLNLAPAELEKTKHVLNQDGINIREAIDKIADLKERLDELGVEDNNNNNNSAQ
ncbi:hypothetical protein GGI06_006100, partial [Coemansia sp. S85]